jgi:hypothetical protein
MTPRRKTSRRDRSLDALSNAQEAVGRALSVLGGKTRNKPKALPAPRSFIARQMLESIVNRLTVVTDLIILGDAPTTSLRNEFERSYDSERRARKDCE